VRARGGSPLLGLDGDGTLTGVVDRSGPGSPDPPGAPRRLIRSPRPWHFFVLVLPYGASFGFVSVALPYVARHRGIAVEAIGAVVAAAFVPHAPKFLWAPVVDVTWSRKGWYLLALALVSAGTFASMAMPITASSLHALTAVIVTSQFGLTLMGMACEGMIGHGVSPEGKPVASGWFQAGTFVGLGVGGGASLKMVEHFGGLVGGALLGLALGGCALPLLWFDEPREAERRNLPTALRELGRDLWSLARSPGGVAALIICISPVGSGAASNLFGAIADEWHASLELVAITTGALGGVVSGVGAGGGGWLVSRMSRRAAYALAGALTAGIAVAMALAPRQPWAYALFTLTYQALNGVAFAAFSALAFETAGQSAVATKYNVLASLVNMSIAYTTRIDGAAHARWGGSGVLLADAAMTGAGIAALATVVAIARRWR
jgi:MFS transporter, PAT family, beta-lactamase induction signal transducer AmpG